MPNKILSIRSDKERERERWTYSEEKERGGD